MKRLIFLLFILIANVPLFASAIYTINSKNGVNYVKHLVALDDNIKSICSNFHISPDIFCAFNNLDITKDVINQQIVLIPLTETNFFKTAGISKTSKNFSPVFLEAEKQNDINTICETYNIEKTAFYHWNKLDFAEKKIYEDVIIGWLKNDLILKSNFISQPIANNTTKQTIVEKPIDKITDAAKTTKTVQPNSTKINTDSKPQPIDKKVSAFLKKTFTNNVEKPIAQKTSVVDPTVQKPVMVQSPTKYIQPNTDKVIISQPQQPKVVNEEPTLKTKINNFLKPRYKVEEIPKKNITIKTPVNANVTDEEISNKTIQVQKSIPHLTAGEKATASLKKFWKKFMQTSQEIFQPKLAKTKNIDKPNVVVENKPVVVRKNPTEDIIKERSTIRKEGSKFTNNVTIKPSEIKENNPVNNNLQVRKLDNNDRFIKKGDDVLNSTELNNSKNNTNKTISSKIENKKESFYNTIKNKINKPAAKLTTVKEVATIEPKVESKNEITIIPPYVEPETKKIIAKDKVTNTVTKPNGVIMSDIKKVTFTNSKKGKTSFFYTGNSSGAFYVFTNLAEKGELIKITNTDNSKYIMAEVIGKLPANDLNKGLIIKLSDNAKMPLKTNAEIFNSKIDY